MALARIQENLTGMLPFMPAGGLGRVASDLLRPGELSVVSDGAEGKGSVVEVSEGKGE
jgi:hypothetical protein